MQNILNINNQKLNIIYYNNLNILNIPNYNDPFKGMDYNDIKLSLSIGYLFSSENPYSLVEGINFLTINKEGIVNGKIKNIILKNNKEIIDVKNNFKLRPEELEYNDILYEEEYKYVDALDVYKNIFGIPILIYSIKNKIYLMNLNTRIIEKEITIDTNINNINNIERFISFLKYYNINNKEYILCQIKEEKIIIFNIQKNFENIFSLEHNNIRSSLLFNFNKKIFLFISFYNKVSIYNFNQNYQLIVSINKSDIINIEQYINILYTDNIFIEENGALYIIITNKDGIISLKYPNYNIYKKYKNFYHEKNVLILPKVYEFENNLIYLMTISNYNTLNIYNFHTSDIIREVYIMGEINDYYFYNYELIMFTCKNYMHGNCSIIMDINTREIAPNYFEKTCITKKIYLDEYGESIIYLSSNWNIVIRLEKGPSNKNKKIKKEKKNITMIV